jgi:hypothetical protein
MLSKTQYNPKLKLDENCDECNFYEQLTFDEKYKYLELKIDKLKSMFAEVHFIKFLTDRNHPDEEIYKTHHNGFYNSDTPTYELAFDLDEKINYYKSKLSILDEEERKFADSKKYQLSN